MKRIFAIGDIHGCLDQLQMLIKKINIDRQNDTLIFIGDYIDRGGQAREVIDYVMELESKMKNVVCLMGNHEEMFLKYLEGIDDAMYLYNGGMATLSSYGISRNLKPAERKATIPSRHLQFYRSLLPFYETENYIFVHAGLTPGVLPAEHDLHDMLWIRGEFIHSDFNFGKRVIFGHTPFEYPLIKSNKIGIDTGAVFGGMLTCVELPQLKIHQA